MSGLGCKLTVPGSSSTESIPTSEDGVASTASSDNFGDISFLALFDDYVRKVRNIRGTNSFLLQTCEHLSEHIKMFLSEYKISVKECQRLQSEVEVKVQEISDLQKNLHMARYMLDTEKKKTRQVAHERDELQSRLSECIALMLDNRNKLLDKYKEKITQLGHVEKPDIKVFDAANNLQAIPEVNSTGSILSDLSYSRSEDDLDSSFCIKKEKGWKNVRPSTGIEDGPAVKKRRSHNNVVEIGHQDTVRATQTVTVSNQGPVTVTSVIEAVPQDGEPPKLESWPKRDATLKPSTPYGYSRTPTWGENNNLLQHLFQQKMICMPDHCLGCNKRIKFGATVAKCKECRCTAHLQCKDKLPLPCVPSSCTPNQRKTVGGTLADYAPKYPPFVPALIVHCVAEIERKGLQELGLYRIPGSEKDVRDLRERFLSGKGSPNLSSIDVHVLCSCVKDFVRMLQEPIFTYTLWPQFVEAVQAQNEEDVNPALCQVISQLPRCNRDTLAYLMLHLRKVADSPECKMPVDNLVKVFAPTLMRAVYEEQNLKKCLEETELAFKVVTRLLQFPQDYWFNFVNVQNTNDTPGRLQQTPSTDSLLRPNTSRFLTPKGPLRKQKFFDTPPYVK